MLDIITKAAEDAGVVLRKYFRQEALDISNKTSHQNIVTEADIESQRIIQETILAEIKKKGISEDTIGFIGEEKLHKVGEHTFVIDPVDGTSNFATGLDEYGVIIGYFYKKELRSGIIYFPEKEEWFVAEKGKGAYAIKKGVRISLKALDQNLQNTFLFASLSYTSDIASGAHEKTIKLKSMFRGVRMIGSAVSELSLLAENIGGCVLLVGCSIWDICAGKLIFDEAGFGMYDWEGNEIVFDLDKPTRTYPFFACHPVHKEAILEKIK